MCFTEMGSPLHKPPFVADCGVTMSRDESKRASFNPILLSTRLEICGGPSCGEQDIVLPVACGLLSEGLQSRLGDSRRSLLCCGFLLFVLLLFMCNIYVSAFACHE